MKHYTIWLLIGVLLALVLVGSVAGDGMHSPLGTLIRLNDVTTNDQVVHGIDMAADGSFVAVWDGQPVDDCCLENDPPDIMARLFDADGRPKGAGFIVNTILEEGRQIMPVVGMAPDGKFLVTYYDDDLDYICSRNYSAAGVPGHNNLCRIANLASGGNELDDYGMNMSPDGRHVAVVWIIGADVYLQHLNDVGFPDSDEVLVAEDADLWETPTVAVDNDGDIVVAWEVGDAPGCDMAVMARRYNADKQPQAAAFQVACNAYDPTAVMSADGKFALVWSGPDDDIRGIFARRFNANGTTDGAVFRVNQTTANNQTVPAAAMNAAGDMYITWKQTEPQIGGIPVDWPIMGRVFPAAGPAGDEFRANAYPGGDPQGPLAAIDPDGRALTAWSNWGQDGSNGGSYAQLGQPELPNVTVLLSTLADGRIGSLRYARGDVLAYDQAAAAWSLYFDASTHGLTKDMADFALLPDGDLLLVVKATANMPGAGSVQPQDVARFDTATQSFSLYLDGSDVGLTTQAERLDALAVDADGSLLLSTVGSATIGGFMARDQDLARFTPTQTGPHTVGVWAELLHGLSYDMPKDLLTVWADTAGDDLYFYMTFDRAVQVSNDFDIPRGTVMRCRPYYPWSGVYSGCLIDLYWDAHAAGLPAKARIDGLELLVGD